MFRKILIANRGEIACRIAATAHRMGVRTVAVYSDADAEAAHVHACDEAVYIGGAAATDSYLRIDRLIDAARQTDAEALHPGYGFLSENADFARACQAAGRVFIGPPAEAIEAMGDKARAKAVMAAAGVPVVAGYHGAAQDLATLTHEAERIGFPLLIKACAGGGGKGMRVVQHAGEMATALAACQREARAAFGDDQVLLERYLRAARHIEVQVFADQHGGITHLFERDCSVQRRHQKVIEEAPAPGLSEALRERLAHDAMLAARQVGYVGAGTVEFIVDADGHHCFMEMNTRLQVEHPVTEAITGEDLVAWQLHIAAGERLPQRLHATPRGHAIEVRLCAEQPEAGFLPATGQLARLRWPTHQCFEAARVRVDSGVREGDVITPHYDAMVAKLIVWGEDRATALARLREALRAVQVGGVHTNVRFLQRLLAHPDVAAAQLDTQWLERHLDTLPSAPEVPHHLAVAGWLAAAMQAPPLLTDPWAHTDGWRLHGQPHRHHRLQVGDAPVRVTVTQTGWGQCRFALDEAPQRWQLQLRPPSAADLALGQVALNLQPLDALPEHGPAQHRLGWLEARPQPGAAPCLTLFTPQGEVAVHDLTGRPDAASGPAGDGDVRAPLPGRVVALRVARDQTVRQGDPLLVMEAMKMEHTLTAPRDGQVDALLCQVGDQVHQGDELMRLQALTMRA